MLSLKFLDKIVPLAFVEKGPRQSASSPLESGRGFDYYLGSEVLQCVAGISSAVPRYASLNLGKG
jgi:hypothetical protein